MSKIVIDILTFLDLIIETIRVLPQAWLIKESLFENQVNSSIKNMTGYKKNQHVKEGCTDFLFRL